MIGIKAGALLVIAGLLVAACDEEETAEPVDTIKAIKTYVVVEPAGGASRTYSGTLAATDTSALSFAVAGTVQAINVAQGDSVAKGQALATLDTVPFDLEVQAAQAELSSAQATYAEKEAEIERERQLFKKGWIAQAALDQAISAFEGASAQLDLTRSRLSIAERNLTNATLIAPFNGTIASREVEPFQEVAAGKPLFLINSEGAIEIDIAVSDTIISRLNAGAPVEVRVPSVEGCGCTGRITEIGTASGAANAVTVTAALLDGPSTLLPGMSAEVRVPLASTSQETGFLVPISAVAPGDDGARGYLFVYDPVDKVVRKSAISGGSSVAGNLVAVIGGVSAGDIVAVAGVSFLRDGQRVKLLGE